jgi:hypothetical protein
MIELLIPQPGEESKNAKDLVFSVLVSEHPLSAIQIFRIINKKYNLGLTYPAIKKAIGSLVEKKVLVKERKIYKINKDWLFNVKSTVDNLITSYESGIKPAIPSTETIKEEYAVYTFTNLFDLDNFWDDLLVHISNKMKNEESHSYFAYVHYAWFLLINLGKETKLFQHLDKNKINCKVLFIGKSPVNIWAKKVYSEIGIKFKLIDNKSLDNTIAFNLIGNTVIQVKYPDVLIKKFQHLYEKYNSIEEISPKEITELAHEKFEIKLNVFKNPEIAQSLREKYEKYFRKV